MENAERLGITIVHFGDQLRTVKCLDSFIEATLWLKRCMPSLETSILIVDNSGNFNLENHRSVYCDIRCLNPRKNLGYAGACCIARKFFPKDSILMFSNNDVILREDSLLNLLETMKYLPKAGAIQPISFAKGTSKVDNIGLTFNTILHCFSYDNYPIEPIKKFVLENGFKVIECFGTDGMLFAIRGRVWDEIGGWDPDFFMYYDAALLSWKLRMSGYRNYVALNSVINHERGGTAKGRLIKEDPMFSSYYTSRNKILSVLYIYRGTWLIVYFFDIILFEFVKNVLLSLKRKSALSLYYYFMALIDILKKSKHIIYQRGKIIRKIDERYFLKQGYIIPLLRSLEWLLKQRKAILG